MKARVRYVLDTNIVAALMKGQSVAIDRLLSLRSTDVALPEPVAAEISYGIARLPSSRKRAQLEVRFGLIRDEISVAPWTSAVSAQFGRVKATLEKRGTLIEDFDIAIAAHALAHDACLVTANTKHMRRIADLRVEDWLSGP